MLFSLAFDFKSNDAGEGHQLLIFMGLLSLSVGFLLILHLSQTLNKQALILSNSTLLFILASSLVGIIYGQKIYDVLSLTMPLLLFIVAMLSTASLNIEHKHIRVLIKILLIFMITSALFKLLFSLSYYNVDFANIRYQIISPVLILLFAYGIASIIYERQPYGYLAIIIPIIIVFISVTRTYLLVFFSIFLFWLLCSPMSYWKRYLPSFFKLSIFSILLIMSMYFIFPDGVERWIARLLLDAASTDVDITAYSRIAESSYQINKLMENSVNLFFGLGLAAETKLSPEYWTLLSSVLGNFEFTGRGYGHNVYIGILYTGGIIFGFLFIYALLISALRIIKSFKARLNNNGDRDVNFLIALGGSAVLGFITYGFLAGTFGDRLTSLTFGLAFGLAFLGINMSNKK
jgi:hypothetical protein